MGRLPKSKDGEITPQDQAFIDQRVEEKTAPWKDASATANRDAARLYPDPAKKVRGKG